MRLKASPALKGLKDAIVFALAFTGTYTTSATYRRDKAQA